MLHSLHSSRALSIRVLVAVAVTALVAAVLTVLAPTAARAAELPPSIGDGGYLISDAEFFDADSMTAGEIQAFLDERVGGCEAESGPTCLNHFRTDLPAQEGDRYCAAIPARANASAAEIIAEVGQACGINPKVILVMLQKEQGLVTSSAPSEWSYRAAMGQACPDTAPCDAAAAGFVNQVYLGARQMQVYTLNPHSFNYRAGEVNTIKWHPSSSCGTSKVFIQNQATANLYIYTPYRPNLAALAAGYGEGDSCSAYGNRNFYNYYVRWFAPGAAASTGAPAQVDACTVPADADIVPAAGTATVTTDGLNVRSAPTLACTSDMSTLSHGSVVTVTGVYSGWVRADLGGRAVWLSQDHLDLSASAPPTSGCTVPADTAIAAASGTVTVTTDRLNVRRAPATSCDDGVEQLTRGAEAERTGVYGEWTRVAVWGESRWVHSDYVAVQAAPAEPAPEPPAPVTMTTTDALNLRASASTSAQILTILPVGTSVTVTGADGAWRAVTVGDRTGWVHGDYLTGEAVAAPAETMYTTDALNLREGASTSSRILTILPVGASVSVTGSEGAWRAVTVGDRTGWVHGDYLSGSSAPAPVTMYTTDALNLREGASMSSRILTILPVGASVSVTGSEGAWRAVTVGDRTGWVHGDYLGSSAPVVTRTTIDYLNLRDGGSMDAGIQTVLAPGTEVTVVSDVDGWTQVSVGGQGGWVASAYLR